MESERENDWIALSKSEARDRNLGAVKTVSQYIELNKCHVHAMKIDWQLLDEDNAFLDAQGQAINYAQYHAQRFDDGHWYLTVEIRGARRYGIIDAMIERAMTYWSMVDTVLASEPKTRISKRVRRIQHLLDWMVQDAWELRQVASAHTFRGILTLFGELVTKETIQNHLKQCGLAKRYGNHMAIWTPMPAFPKPDGIRPVPAPPEPDWKALVASWHGTTDAWPGRAICPNPECHMVNVTRPFCFRCGALVKWTHDPIVLADLDFLL
jgi:hypothetical protein